MDKTSEVAGKLNPRQELAIIALLQAPSVTEAAKVAGVGQATLIRWMRTTDFIERYNGDRRQVMDGALIELQSLTGAAVAKLRELLNCGNKATELRATQVILEHDYRARELYEHEERIQLLEAVVKEQEAAERAKRERDQRNPVLPANLVVCEDGRRLDERG